MKITKDTKFMCVEGCAIGYYSDAERTSIAFLPLDLYKKYENEINELEIYIGDLDGKHSETEMSINIEEIDIQNYKNIEIYKLEDDILFYEIFGLLEDEDLQSFKSFNKCLKEIPKDTIREDDFILTEDVILNGSKYIAGSRIKVNVTEYNELEDDWFIEY